MIAQPLRPRTIVYIDGFNLYYGVFKAWQFERYKWLNFDEYFTRLLPGNNVIAIKYFSALLEHQPAACARQSVYWEALKTLALTKIIPGNFKSKSVKCRNRACGLAGDRVFDTWEEKRTDVNIALEILGDAYQGLADEIVLVSGDSDLAPALQAIRTRFPTRVRLYVPAAFNPIRGRAAALRALAHKARNFDGALCAHTQFPNPITLPDGTNINKPATW